MSRIVKTPSHSLFLLISLLLMFSSIGFASGLKKIGQTNMKWLSIPQGARGAALGNAYVALADDIDAVFWNPAGLGYVENIAFMASNNQWFADMAVNSFALAYNRPDFGVISLTYSSMDYGPIYGTRLAPGMDGVDYIETGEFQPSDNAIGLAYGRRISEMFAIGVHLKYVSENLGSGLIGAGDDPQEFKAKMSVLAMDVGTIYYFGFKDLRLAMSLQNFSEEKSYRTEVYPLPLIYKIGLAMDLMQLVSDNSLHSAVLSIEGHHPRDFSERLHIGLEYAFNRSYFLRVGYKLNYDEEALSTGAGIKINLLGSNLIIDYAYVPMEHLGATQTFTLGVEL